MAVIGPRDQLDAAIAQLAAAARALQVAGDALISEHGSLRRSRQDVLDLRVDAMRVRRQLEEAREELTPLRPSSSADVKAAFASAQSYPTLKAVR
jgi:hypothetical protein